MRTVFLLLLVTYGYFVPPVSWNGNSRFDLTRALVEEGRVTIDSFHRNTGDKAELGGHVYTDKAPGVSLLGAPAYAIFLATLTLTHQPLPAITVEPARRGATFEHVTANRSFSRGIYVVTLTAVSLWSALGGAILFGFLRARTGSPAQALALTAACALGSPILPYSTMLYGHATAAAQLWIAFSLVVPWRPTDPAPTARRFALAGLLCGLATLCEYPAAGGAALLGLFVLHQHGRSAAVAFALGGAPAACALFAYHAAAFGGPLSTGYAHVQNPLFAGQQSGFFGIGWPRPGVVVSLLFGKLRGLFWVAPVLALAALGLPRLVKTTRLWPAAAVPAFFLLVNAGYYMWWGGSAYGPRHLLPALPFLVLGLLALPAPLARARLPLLALSIANALAATAIGPEAPARGDLLADHVWSFILAGRVAVESGTSNLGLEMRLPGLLSLVPLLALWAAGANVVLREPAEPA